MRVWKTPASESKRVSECSTTAVNVTARLATIVERVRGRRQPIESTKVSELTPGNAHQELSDEEDLDATGRKDGDENGEDHGEEGGAVKTRVSMKVEVPDREQAHIIVFL